MGAKSRSYRDYLLEKLQDESEAQEYLNAAFEDYSETKDYSVLLLAIRDVAEARGMSAVAKHAELNRPSLYRSLSESGNPEFQSICSIMDAMGFQIEVKRKHAF